MAQEYVDRPPRIQPELPLGEIEIPAPPRSDEGRQNPLQVLLPIVTVVIYIVVAATGQQSNINFILPMALGVLVSTGITGWIAWSTYRQRVQRERNYVQLLSQMRDEMVAKHDEQRTYYESNYPMPLRVLDIDGKRQNNRSGSRLWERRSSEADFGFIRIGLGTRPSTYTYNLSSTGGQDSPLMRDAQRLANDSRYVLHAPITIPFYQRPIDEDENQKKKDAPEILAVKHALGICGKPDSVYPVIRSMMAHYAAFHSPLDSQLYVLGLHQAREKWDWISPLPHCKGSMDWLNVDRLEPYRRGRLGGDTLLYFEPISQQTEHTERDKESDPVAGYWKMIWQELDRRARRLRDKDENDTVNITLPFMLIVVDLLASLPHDEKDVLRYSSLRDLESEAAISLLMEQGPQLGAAVIFLVPNRQKVPSGCTAVIEVNTTSDNTTGGENLRFLYAEVGLNTPRYIGQADRIDTDDQINRLSNFAKTLGSQQIRRSFGADLPHGIGFLDLLDAKFVSDLHISSQWLESVDTEKPDWLEVRLGAVSGRERRRLKFSADADGVHGMIAGSTGSGKSELLMTMILTLAVKYDPSIVNFVLVDYKGGSAFDPFDDLPHVVDKVTNLGSGAVARMFAAIKAELDRRQRINQARSCKHIVEYRKRKLHKTQRDYYPHLFIIIDEFAEMISNNPEYKAQLDSITRLGRALGVSLILAAQRPTGVTDQMRANIKFRICLRVETRDESNELLRRPDANYLPSIPGRGYLQVGSESLQEVQVAYTGMDYTENDVAHNDLELLIHRLQNDSVVWLEDLEKQEAPKLFEVLVEEMASLVVKKYQDKSQRPWRKPWPSPIPTQLWLNDGGRVEVEYLARDDREFLEDQLEVLPPQTPFALNPIVGEWVTGRQIRWTPVGWKQNAMRVVIGLLDDPNNAQLRTMMMNLNSSNYAVFGSAGWGKTTLLRTLLTGLAATHSPTELHIYIMDFGNRSLEDFSDLPHTGAYILPDQGEEIRRLLLFLERTIRERNEKFSAAGADNLYSYNEKNPDDIQPALLVILDNFAGFRENYETRIEILIPLIREGVSMGVHFVITSDQVTTLGKLFNLFTERIALKMADKSDYASVMGRPVQPIDESIGRGYYTVNRVPLELQVALPIKPTDDELKSGIDDRSKLFNFITVLKGIADELKIPESKKPFPIQVLQARVQTRELLPPTIPQRTPTEICLGISDVNLKPLFVNLERKHHFAVTGGPSSGKTTALYHWILSIASSYTPDQAVIILVDRQGKLNDYGGKRMLTDLPHVIGGVISEPPELADLWQTLKRELTNPQANRREIYVFFDNYDDIVEFTPQGETLVGIPYSRLLQELGLLARRFGSKGLHFIICGLYTNLRTADDFTRPIFANRYGLALDSEGAGSSPLNGRVPMSINSLELPPGRGFVVVDGRITMLQVAAPYGDDSQRAEHIDQLVAPLIGLYPDADWTQQRELPPSNVDNLNLTSPQIKRITGEIKRATSEQHAIVVGTEYNAEEMKQLREILAETMQVPVEELRLIPDDTIVAMAQTRGLSIDQSEMPKYEEHTFSAEEIAELRVKLAERLKCPIEDLADFSDNDIIEMAKNSRLI